MLSGCPKVINARIKLVAAQTAMVLAIVAMAVPGSALPCQAPQCFGTTQALASESTDSCGCCAGKASNSRLTEDTGFPTEESHKHQPCDCPPGCPAPCGSGKLPTMTASVLVGPAMSGPVLRVVGIAQTTHTTSAVADILRPPRA